MLIKEAQILYAETTAIPYDSTRIGKTKACLYRIGNALKLPISDMAQHIKANKKAVRKAAEHLAGQDEQLQAIATMGTLSTQLGWILGALYAPADEVELPQLGSDIFAFLNTLAVLEALPHVKVKKVQ